MLVAALAVLAWPARPGWRHAGIAGLLLGAAVTVRLAGLPLVILAALYLLLARGGWRRRLAPAAVVVVGFLVPVAGYAAYYALSTGGGPGLSHAGGNALYGRVATFADCATLDLPAPEQDLCPKVPRELRPGPDYWAHDPGVAGVRCPAAAGDQRRHVPARLQHAGHPPAAGRLRRRRARRRREGVRLGPPATPTRRPPNERWRFQTEFPTFPSLVTIDEITWLSHAYHDGPPR